MCGWGTWRTEHGEGRELDRLLSPLEKENIIIRSHSPRHASVVGVHVRCNLQEVSPTQNQREYGRKSVKVASSSLLASCEILIWVSKKRKISNYVPDPPEKVVSCFIWLLVGDMRHPDRSAERLGHVLDPRAKGEWSSVYHFSCL